MPTISLFDGIAIYMYWQEHGIPHLHAIRGDEQAVFAIETGEVLVGSMSRRARRRVSAWILARRTELFANWQRGRDGLPFLQVPGPHGE